MSETTSWTDDATEIEVELGVLVAAASAWTEDETELDDLVRGLVESERTRIAIDGRIAPRPPASMDSHIDGSHRLAPPR